MVFAQYEASQKDVYEQTSVKLKIQKNRTRCDIAIMSIVMITMHRYGNLDYVFNNSGIKTKYVSRLLCIKTYVLKLLNLNVKIKDTLTILANLYVSSIKTN